MLAAVQFPILGVDFLGANSLIVDAAASRLIHLKSLRQILAAEGAVGDDGLSYTQCATPAGDDRAARHRQILDAVKLRAAK